MPNVNKSCESSKVSNCQTNAACHHREHSVVKLSETKINSAKFRYSCKYD